MLEDSIQLKLMPGFTSHANSQQMFEKVDGEVRSEGGDAIGHLQLELQKAKAQKTRAEVLALVTTLIAATSVAALAISRDCR